MSSAAISPSITTSATTDHTLNILFVSDVYFPRVNGVSTSIHSFIKQLQSLGHVVHLIAPAYDAEIEAQADEDWIIRVPARKVIFDPEDHLMKLHAAHALIPQLAKGKYDLVHIHTPFVAHYLGKKIAKKLNIPVVETYHTFFEDYLHHYLSWLPSSVSKWLARLISKKQCNAVDALVSPSQPMLDVLRAYGINTAAKVVATGLEAASFSSQDFDFKQQYGITQDRQVLLYVGRVAFEKNIDFLLGVVDVLCVENPSILLVITGEGPAVTALQKRVQALGISYHVRFLGYLDREVSLNACYRAADVFVFASTSETQGLVVLEAMAQATPVVAIAQLGTASVLAEGKGALIAEEDTYDFASKVQALLSDQPRRIALGLAGLQYVQENWTAQQQAVSMSQFYQALITQKNDKHRYATKIAQT